MSCAQILGDEALQASCENGDERNRNESDEVLLRALEEGVQPPVAAQSCEGPLNHPADATGDEPSVAAASNRIEGDARRFAGFRQPLAPATEIARRRAWEATIGAFAQNRQDTFRVMAVRRRNIDRQRDSVFVHRDMHFDAPDLLAAVDTTIKAARR